MAACTERIVLAPVDDSEHSDAAVRWAATHVLRPGDVLHILAVVRILVAPKLAY
jgi:nucleotide-binding universal stress UspA family protein